MSDSTASSRALKGSEEFDRRIRSIGQAPSDALAELARLVGQQDPFRPGAGGLPLQTHSTPLATLPMALDEDLHPETGAGEEPVAPPEPPVFHAAVPEPQAWERVVPRFPSISPREHHVIEPTPDLWARGAEDEMDDGADAPALIATRERAPAEQTSAGRTLVVLAAVIALTGGGLAASFLAKPSASPASASETPTILAATGPIKVQPETAPAGEDAPSEPSKLLDKNKNDGTAEAKVVNTTEQPVDLAQVIKPAPPEVADLPAVPASPFPEPHKVKTILVRPDGSIIADAVPAPEALPTSATNQQASLAFDTRTALPPVTRDLPLVAAAPPPAEPPVAESAVPAAVETAKPSVGKTRTRVPAASTAPDGSAAAQARTSVATPKTKPVAHVAPKTKPKPVENVAAPVAVADAGPAAEAPAAAEPAAMVSAEKTNGSFAIQLGAALSEAEGQAAASKLGQKYADDLGGVKPSVYKAQSGGKTVYRIRVGNLSQDSAKTLCVKVQAGGGGCFVAR